MISTPKVGFYKDAREVSRGVVFRTMLGKIEIEDVVAEDVHYISCQLTAIFTGLAGYDEKDWDNSLGIKETENEP